MQCFPKVGLILFEIKVNIKHKSLELKGQSYEKKFQSELGVRFNFRANVSMARSNFVGLWRDFSHFSVLPLATKKVWHEFAPK